MMEEPGGGRRKPTVEAHQALDSAQRLARASRPPVTDGNRAAARARHRRAGPSATAGDPGRRQGVYTEHSPVREGLEELRRLASAHRFDVLVLIFPHAYGTGADRGGAVLPELSEYPHAWVFDNARMVGLCRELGFTCIDLAGVVYQNPRLRALSSRRMFNDGCCHLGVLGHKVMAWASYRELVARHLMR
jgi:hypothetical protein